MPRVIFFQGQGLVYPRMGIKGIDPEISKRLFERASDISHLPLRVISEEGRPEMVRADVSQLLAGIQGLGYCETYYPDLAGIDFAAGHSSGQITAIGATKMVGDEEFFSLLWPRADGMHKDAGKVKGGMYALVCREGYVDVEAIMDICEKFNLSLANKNSPKQMVVSGLIVDLKRAKPYFEKLGYLCIWLKVEGAFHSSFMNGAVEEIKAAIGAISFRNPQIPIFSNLTGKIITDWKTMVEEIPTHVVSTVFWWEICVGIIGAGITRKEDIVETAERKVLTGFFEDTLNWYKVTYPEEFAKLARG